jgi:hypothetical protein
MDTVDRIFGLLDKMPIEQQEFAKLGYQMTLRVTGVAENRPLILNISPKSLKPWALQ